MSLNDSLKTSQAGLDLIAKWEGCILKQYICPAGKPTIGIGHVVLPGEKFPERITREFALELLAKDVIRFENAIKKHVTVALNQNQFDALVTFLFNTGEGGIINTGVQRELNAGNYDKVPGKMMEWCKFVDKNDGVKKVNIGLQNRRRSEGQLFSTPASQTQIVNWNRNLLSQVQTELKKLGLYSINIDGLFGPTTLKGLTEFCRLNGLTLNPEPKLGVDKLILEKLNLKV